MTKTAEKKNVKSVFVSIRMTQAERDKLNSWVNPRKRADYIRSCIGLNDLEEPENVENDYQLTDNQKMFVQLLKQNSGGTKVTIRDISKNSYLMNFGYVTFLKMLGSYEHAGNIVVNEFGFSKFQKSRFLKWLENGVNTSLLVQSKIMC